MADKPRILVVGSGAIGGTVATVVADAGTAEVHIVARNPAVADALETHGLRTCGIGSHRVAHAVVHRTPPEESFDVILLATPPPAVEQAARSVLHCAGNAGLFVVLQNGLCESRVAAIAGAERTVGGIVTFGASTDGNGVFERTSTGGITLGRIDGTLSDLEGIARILQPVGPIAITTNLMGARFSKLTVNCAVSGLGTVAGTTLGSMLMKRVARNGALRVMREAVAVARAEGITLERLNGAVDIGWLADPSASDRGVAHWLRHAVLLAVGFRYRKLRSSMLRAIEADRPPSVDFLNGEIAARGHAHGIDTPCNAAVVSLVHQIHRGETHSSPSLLQSLP